MDVGAWLADRRPNDCENLIRAWLTQPWLHSWRPRWLAAAALRRVTALQSEVDALPADDPLAEAGREAGRSDEIGRRARRQIAAVILVEEVSGVPTVAPWLNSLSDDEQWLGSLAGAEELARMMIAADPTSETLTRAHRMVFAFVRSGHPLRSRAELLARCLQHFQWELSENGTDEAGRLAHMRKLRSDLYAAARRGEPGARGRFDAVCALIAEEHDVARREDRVDAVADRVDAILGALLAAVADPDCQDADRRRYLEELLPLWHGQIRPAVADSGDTFIPEVAAGVLRFMSAAVRAAASLGDDGLMRLWARRELVVLQQAVMTSDPHGRRVAELRIAALATLGVRPVEMRTL